MFYYTTTYTEYTKNNLCEAIKENNISLVSEITTDKHPPRKDVFDVTFTFLLIYDDTFGIKINRDILTMLDKHGFFSTHAKALYASKNNDFKALNDSLKNNQFDKSILCAALNLAAKNSGYKMIDMLSNLKCITDHDRAEALLAVANRDTSEMLENEEPKIANILLHNSLSTKKDSFHWEKEHVLAWEAALQKGKLWLIEMLLNFPDSGFLAKFKKENNQTPLYYTLSKTETKADASILLLLIEHALTNFGVRFDEEKDETMFFEKINDENMDHVWDKNTLKVLFKAVLPFPTQTNKLLTLFPTIFKPIAEVILAETKDTPPLSIENNTMAQKQVINRKRKHESEDFQETDEKAKQSKFIKK